MKVEIKEPEIGAMVVGGKDVEAKPQVQQPEEDDILKKTQPYQIELAAKAYHMYAWSGDPSKWEVPVMNTFGELPMEERRKWVEIVVRLDWEVRQRVKEEADAVLYYDEYVVDGEDE